MATTKKTAAKKAPTKAPAARKTPAKKTIAAKTTTKKPAAKKTTAPVRKAPVKRKAASKKTPAMRSFHLSTQEQPPFKSFQITRQTVYWIILVSVIIFAQLWILKTQYEVIELLDQQLLSFDI